MGEAAAQHMLEAAIATGLGLMIGLEREHHDVQQAGERPVEVALGVRTFGLIALLGWAVGYLATWYPWLAPLAVLVVGGLVAAAYFRGQQGARGLTSEVAAIVTLMLGMLVTRERALAASLAVVTTLLLISKPWFGKLVPRLSRMDLTATLQMAILLAIVLPLLPEQASDPWGVLSPRRIGLFVTLVLGVDYVGYVLHRALGRQRGAGLTGLIGGLASSTAVTAAMAQDARRDESGIAAGQLATFLASAVMAVRIVVISAIVNQRVALALAPALGAALAFFLGGALWKWRKLRGSEPARERTPVELANPLAILPAVKWGLFLSFVLVVAAVGQQLLGDRGVIVAGALSGLADVDAITLAVSRQVQAGDLPLAIAVLAIVVAAGMNTIVKAGIALISGGRKFGRDIALVFAAALVAAMAVAVILRTGRS